MAPSGGVGSVSLGRVRDDPTVPFGLVLWVVCLNGGTLALNSAFDRDEGDVAYLRRPPPPPRRLAEWSLALMAAGQVLAFLLPLGFRLAYALCFVLSVLYSVPPFRLKAVAGADWLINMWGFGTLTPYAGWAATGVPVDPARRLVLLAFCPLFASLYPLTQIYQLEEDTRRGDRTLACVLGVRRSLDAALASAGLLDRAREGGLTRAFVVGGDADQPGEERVAVSHLWGAAAIPVERLVGRCRHGRVVALDHRERVRAPRRPAARHHQRRRRVRARGL